MRYRVSRYTDDVWKLDGVFDTITEARNYVEHMVSIGLNSYLIEVEDGGKH